MAASSLLAGANTIVEIELHSIMEHTNHDPTSLVDLVQKGAVPRHHDVRKMVRERIQKELLCRKYTPLDKLDPSIYPSRRAFRNMALAALQLTRADSDAAS